MQRCGEGSFPSCFPIIALWRINKWFRINFFLNNCCLGNCAGISIIDFTLFRVWHDKCARRHKTFREFVTRGKGTMGCLCGFKLHIVIIIVRGEIAQWKLTQANANDRTPSKDNKFTENILGKLGAEKGIHITGSVRKIVCR